MSDRYDARTGDGSRRDYTRDTRDNRDEGRGRDTRDNRDEPRGRGDDRGRDAPSSRFTYTPRTREQVEKRATMGASDFDKILKPHIKVWTPRNGDNRVRILPATWANPIHYGFDIYVHYQVGPDRQAYLDLRRMKDEPDPISAERDELRRSGRATEREIKDLNSTRRVLCYIIDRDAESEGVQAWVMAQTLDANISGVSVDPDTKEVLNIDDPAEGYDVTFRKEGEKLNTKYSAVNISRRPSKLGSGAWLDYAIKYPLPDQLQYFTYEQIAKEFGGGGVHRERDDRGDARADDRSTRGQERNEGDDRGRADAGSSRDDGGRGGRSRDDAPARSDDRSRDEGRGRGDDRGRAEPVIDYEAVQGMTYEELCVLIESDRKLSTINPKESKDDAELRKWVCEDLKLDPPTAREQVSTRRSAAPQEPEPTDKLAEMRRQRGER